MSVYSGKCDFLDYISGYKFSEIQKAEIYHCNVGPLRISTPSDLFPLYTHLITSSSSSRDDNGKLSLNINLSSESYIDSEEEKRIDSIYNDALKDFRKAKRNKTLDKLKNKRYNDHKTLFFSDDLYVNYYSFLNDFINSNGKDVYKYNHHLYGATSRRIQFLKDAIAFDSNLIKHPIFIQMYFDIVSYEKRLHECKKIAFFEGADLSNISIEKDLLELNNIFEKWC